MKRVVDIATALGPGRTREELLPFLNESIDDEDDVLLILADKLGRMVGPVGGAEYSVCLLMPLEKLAMVEEAAVREKAIESMHAIAKGLSEAVRGALRPVRRLATRDWFTSRISACALLTLRTNVSLWRQRRNFGALWRAATIPLWCRSQPRTG